MRKAGKLAAETLDMLTEHVVPGVTTEELDRICNRFITKNGAIPAPLAIRAIRNPSAPRSTMSCVTASLRKNLCAKATFEH
jgi:methionine aminopeptidase